MGIIPAVFHLDLFLVQHATGSSYEKLPKKCGDTRQPAEDTIVSDVRGGNMLWKRGFLRFDAA